MAEGGVGNPSVHAGNPPSKTAATSLSFIDFVPNKYESFSELISMANAWLKRNRSERVVTCEMRNVVKSSGGISPLKSSFSVFTAFSSAKPHFFRCLRLWLTKSDSLEPQQIQCVVRAPEHVHGDSRPFTEVIKDINASLQRSRLKGKIINVQTLPYKMSSNGTLDLERTDWHIQNEVKYRYLNVVHIFYESGQPAMEYIGFADFTPSRLTKGVVSMGEFEKLGTVVERAVQWVASTRDIRVCNVQTLNSKVKKNFGGEEELDSTRSMYTENLNGATYYARFVRVMYTKSASAPPPDNPPRIYYRDFEPTRNQSTGKYETQENLLPAINNWLRTTGYRVLSAETVAVSESKLPEETYTRITSHGKHYVYILRLFITKS